MRKEQQNNLDWNFYLSLCYKNFHLSDKAEASGLVVNMCFRKFKVGIIIMHKSPTVKLC